MTNEIINYNDKKLVDTLKATVAQGLNDHEFMLFVQLCKSSGLNPFRKEVWAIKAGGRLQIMTGINGYLAIANNHHQFDGMEVDVETDDKGKPTKATCKVYRKDRRFPSVGIALMSEFGKETPIWKQMPSVMLTKVAKSIAIREAFPQELAGIYTEEEMPREFSLPVSKDDASVTSLNESVDSNGDPVFYNVPGITASQSTWMRQQGAEWNEQTGTWIAPRDLGPRLSQFKLAAPLSVDEPLSAHQERRKAGEQPLTLELAE